MRRPSFIVDAQIHIWASPTGPAHHRKQPLGAAELVRLMDEAGVSRAINCPPNWDPDAAEIADAAASNYPDRLATMGVVPLSPGGDPAQLAGLMLRPGMLGLRLLMVDAQVRNGFEHGELDWLWEAAERLQVPVAFAVRGELAGIARVAQKFPQLRVTVDHFGAGAFGKVPEAFAHFPALLRLSERPNVAVKLTAAPGYATDAFPFLSVHPYIQQLVEAFGATRCFWGTDITRMPCPWSDCIDMFVDHMPWLDDADLHEIMGHAICRWLGWAKD